MPNVDQQGNKDEQRLCEELQKQIRHSLEKALRRFKPVPRMPGFKRPRAKVSSLSLFEAFNDPGDYRVWDFVADGCPWGFRERSIISMSWTFSFFSLAAIEIAPKTWLYFESNDLEQGVFFLGLSENQSHEIAHKRFLRELCRSNGKTFDTGICGGSPPREVSCSMPRTFLAECFLKVADVSLREFGCEADFWDEAYGIIDHHKPKARVLSNFNYKTSSGRAAIINAYLAAVL